MDFNEISENNELAQNHINEQSSTEINDFVDFLEAVEKIIEGESHSSFVLRIPLDDIRLKKLEQALKDVDLAINANQLYCHKGCGSRILWFGTAVGAETFTCGKCTARVNVNPPLRRKN